MTKTFAREPAWERQPRESPASYEAFRQFRDLGPLRSVSAVQLDGYKQATIYNWSGRFAWVERARAWDDQAYREADAVRLDALRDMQRSHALAGRVALSKALGALQHLSADDITGAVAVRLLEVGTRLESRTLAQSLAELQGITVDDGGQSGIDPWEVIARELAGSRTAVRDASQA